MNSKNIRSFGLFGKSTSSLPTTKKNKKRPPLTLEQLEARMLMAIDVLEQQLEAAASPALFSVSSSAVNSANSVQGGSNNNSIQLVSAGRSVTNGQRLISNENQVNLQVLRDSAGNYPNLAWTITSTDSLARGVAEQSGGIVRLTFSRPVDYRVTATTATSRFTFNVRITPSLASLAVAAGSVKLANATLNVATTNATLTVTGLDQINRNLRLPGELSWSIEQGPSGAQVQFQTNGARTKVTFDRAGEYTLRVNCGNVSTTVRINVAQTFRSLAVTPNTNSLNTAQTLQLTASALDQFQRPMVTQPTITWTATGGTITSEGLFTAGNRAGNFRVTARAGTLTARANISVLANNNNNNNGGGGQGLAGISDSALRSLVTTYYADNSISRDEMIQILRTAGTDALTATELTDLRFIVSTTSSLRMPEFVRVLGSNVVTNNPANLRYQGQNAGNLAAGSSSILVNNLVDKWFLGTDTPTLTSNNLSYRTAVGSLFPTNPGLNDSQQGMLGDCYFLASMVSIANKNPDTVRNMFIENSDTTVTVRFYANGKADYITVNRSLPTFSNGTLAYSGYGRSASNAQTPLWLALAEKAYAQWNETGKQGRDGSNTYAGIEGGWMGDVNSQVLGYSSSNFAVNAINKQNLINSLNGGAAVTIGTTENASAGGLVGSHAYVVTSYNAVADTFSFYNPWSTQHPTALTWNQMQGQFSYFVVASPNGSGSNGTVVSSTHFDTLQTYVESTKSPLASSADDDRLIQKDDTTEMAQAGDCEFEYDAVEAIAAELYAYTESQPAEAADAQAEELADLLIELSLIAQNA